MPASSADLISSALRTALSKKSTGNYEEKSNFEDQLNASSKQIFLYDIEYEYSNAPQSFVLNNLKSKYVTIISKGKKGAKQKGAGQKKSQKGKMAHCRSEDKLDDPRVTLWSPDKVVLGWRKSFPPGAGMVNLGNTCYMNSSLQALFHIPSLVNWLLEEISTHIPNCEANTQNASFCSVCGMMRTLKLSLDRGNNVIKPSFIHNKLKSIGKTLMYGRQEDAHEFIKLLLDHMEKSFLHFKRATKLDYRSKETTPLNQIFGGYLRQQVICPLCCYVSTTFSHFQDLVLDIRSVGSVEDALNLYFKKETLDSDNAYKCEKCHKKVPATKHHLIEKAPHVLLLQLKRFTISGGKITKHVNIQKNIDISRYVNSVKSTQPNGSGPYFYRLVSMVIHIGGSQHGGHYTAVAEASNNTMFEFDDSSVRPISVQSALLRNPYILFYEMVRKPKALAGPKQVIRQSSEKALLRQSSSDKISKPLPTSLSASCMWNGVGASAADNGEAVGRNSLMAHSKKSPLLSQKERDRVSFGIKLHTNGHRGQENGKFPGKGSSSGLQNGSSSKAASSSSTSISSSKASSTSNGKRSLSSSLVPYNDDSDDSEEGSKGAAPPPRLTNGHHSGKAHVNGHHANKETTTNGKVDRSPHEGSKLNGKGDRDAARGGGDRNGPGSGVGADGGKSKGSDKAKTAKAGEEKAVNNNGSSSLGSLKKNGKAAMPAFLPRSLQVVQSSSASGKEVGGGGGKANGNPRAFNGASADKKLNLNGADKKPKEKEENKTNARESHPAAGAAFLNGGGILSKFKKDDGWIVTDSSERSPSESSSCSSCSSQGFLVTEKQKRKNSKKLGAPKDRADSSSSCNNGWTVTTVPSSSKATEPESSTSPSQDCISPKTSLDRSETVSLKSKESLDSNRSDKSSRSVKKSIFALFPCVSSTHSPDLSPEEQANSIIENKTLSPVRVDPKRKAESSSSSSTEGPHRTNGAQEPPEEALQAKRNRDRDDQPLSPSKKCRPEDSRRGKDSGGPTPSQGGGTPPSSEAKDSPTTAVSERLQPGGKSLEDDPEEASEPGPSPKPSAKKAPLLPPGPSDLSKSERSPSTRDEENFSMEEKKSRHKRELKGGGGGGSDPTPPPDRERVDCCQSRLNPDVVAVEWNRNLKDLSHTLANKKFSKAPAERGRAWDGTNDLSVVNALKQAGELPFGVKVNTWEGAESAMDREVCQDRLEAKKRSVDDVYNDEFDQGKVSKKRYKNNYFEHSNNNFKENPFQKFQTDHINTPGNTTNNTNNSFSRNSHFRSNSYNNNRPPHNDSRNNHNHNSHMYSFNRKFNNNSNHNRNRSWHSSTPPFHFQQQHSFNSQNKHRWYPRNNKSGGERGDKMFGRRKDKFALKPYRD